MAGAYRCSAVARADGYLPAGSAGAVSTFVLVEAPLPWPGDVGDHPLLAPLKPLLQAAGARLQAVVPQAGGDAGATTVVVFHRPPGDFVAFTRTEASVPTADLPAALAGLLDPGPTAAGNGGNDGNGSNDGNGGSAGNGGSGGSGGAEAMPDLGGPSSPQASSRSVIASGVGPPPVTDVLVCTHGSRDRCCGSDGMRVFGNLVRRDLPGVRLWRTSHTGGHRFAPTAVTLPDGRAWAWADAPLLQQIVDRTLAPELAAEHDRGCVAFEDPYAQTAESAVIGIEGWRWLGLARHADVEPVGLTVDDRRIVTLTGTDADGTRVRYRAEVVLRRIVPVPDCGRPLDEARKSSPELEVTHLERQPSEPPVTADRH